LVCSLHQKCQAQSKAYGQQEDVEGDMWAHVAFVIVTAANLASHVVILTTVDYGPITDQLVTTGVRYQGRAILLAKGPHAFVVIVSAFDQILVLVAFQSALFTVIFSTIAFITLQSRHWLRRRRETIKHIQNALTVKSSLLTLMCYFFLVWVKGSVYIRSRREFLIVLDVRIYSFKILLQGKFVYFDKCLYYSLFKMFSVLFEE